MTGLDAERLVSLSADGRRGSGYLLTPELVLTAGHCVGPKGSAVTARAYTRHEGSYDLSQERHTFRVAVWGDEEPDYALLESTADHPFRTARDGPSGEVRLGRLIGEGAVTAQALGFPRSRVEQAGARRLVNPEDVRGRVLPLTGSRREVRRLNLQIRTGSSPFARGASLWSGMSGAALFSGDHLIGVITEDRATIEGRLIALPVSAVFGRRGGRGERLPAGGPRQDGTRAARHAGPRLGGWRHPEACVQPPTATRSVVRGGPARIPPRCRALPWARGAAPRARRLV
ncbi:trypsin-like peptidase domain-containing protein [Streptomyces sp. NPDC088921]|uniref:trypsin-like peptidase domain-containing protein n=1 Tax=unclassified Streptomyces TaxID=2593676 RepID=UPI00344034DE